MNLIRKYYAEDAIERRGNVIYRKNGSRLADGMVLEGAQGGGFLDFSEPVLNSENYLNTIPAGRDSCTWVIDIPRDGIYQIEFRYNNPGFKMSGDRNLRDERNCRVMLDVSQEGLLGNTGWLGWLIFNVSGYHDSSKKEKEQILETIAGNTVWNHNFINCHLTAGKHRLSLVLEAPPGQAVYDGPNIDYLGIRDASSVFISEDSIPLLSSKHIFCHEGMLLTRKRCEKLQKFWKEKEETTVRALSQLSNTRLGSLDYQPHRISKIDVGPYNNPNQGGKEWTEDCIATHYHAILWAVKKDSKHAQKAIEIMDCWAENLVTVAEGNDLKLRFALVGLDMLCAAEIIRYWYNSDPETDPDSRWSRKSIAVFTNFLRAKIYGKTKDFYPQANGNWDAIIGAFNMAVATFTEDRSGFNRCLRQFYLGDTATDDALSMGALPNYVYFSGESQESNRDQIHARMGLTGLCHQSWIASGQGLNLFAAYEERLLKGVKYSAAYQNGKPVASETFISDRGRGTADIASMCYAIILGWYSGMDLDLDEVEKACRLTLNEEVENEAMLPASYWGWLLFNDR